MYLIEVRVKDVTNGFIVRIETSDGPAVETFYDKKDNALMAAIFALEIELKKSRGKHD